MSKVEITIDEHSGFCFGVVYAIQQAEDELDDSGELYCLGDIVHNDLEVERLNKKGLRIISHEDFRNLRNCKVLIRAHGEPPETYRIALENNIELIDASCPVVLKLQNRIKNSYDKMADEGQVVIYGQQGHAEVNGLQGQTNGEAIIITIEEDLEQIDFKKPVDLFSQTTKSTSGFYNMKSLIESNASSEVKANDTICRQVSNRDPRLRDFANKYDVVIFVSGKKSSNGKVLYNVCKAENPNTYFVSGLDELKSEWFQHVAKIGVCGATSTPMWLMQQIAESIRKITSPA